ncbi:hypothetical protein EZV73_17560 [Acidaminobacter sp. JC074]|uniref:4Fe-4S binding protein n=1 Tax=Acidaminobacter sp. JC074 TaxID=2530199 RepID=UPI001F0ED3CD|nr:4Fe-4S binding protein [Acidaminobacter sp. JC074]MCH4889410.1 hypothetical protein [Acidaminobacter sp. JC074]
MKEKKLPKFDYVTCCACKVCVGVCPVDALDLTISKKNTFHIEYPTLKSHEACIGCGICASKCPIDVIEMNVVN